MSICFVQDEDILTDMWVNPTYMTDVLMYMYTPASSQEDEQTDTVCIHEYQRSSADIHAVAFDRARDVL